VRGNRPIFEVFCRPVHLRYSKIAQFSPSRQRKMFAILLVGIKLFACQSTSRGVLNTVELIPSIES
jgi:hypothetical protein